MKGDGGGQQNRSPRLPSWAWIIIVPLVSWLALFVVLIFAGMVPLGTFGFLSGASSESTPIPDQPVRVLKGHTASVKGVAFSPDSSTLASVGDEAEGRLKLWRVADGTLLYSVDAHKDGARCVAFSPDGKLMATGGQDGRSGSGTPPTAPSFVSLLALWPTRLRWRSPPWAHPGREHLG